VVANSRIERILAAVADAVSCDPLATFRFGAGGMGEVYQVHDTKLGRYVAVKVLPEAFAHDSERLSRFQCEVKMLASLSEVASK
jgi:hypothetical protein